ncbi:TetR/AcrR family transcriptional regulator [Streptomyces sp. CB01881]|uniref:TetR/AcrR family transcriptional regulator n=1 Tax=Streptomyces sp. CB01881 TaxID=2078691 RepID=UPI000CDC52BA|nr:TetR/AcrR family transcriptional regulator [Streptomyces sp. CB01881]AUY51086.1 TetR family transcriptional regulator [Streptomyces sp. CB01881]TYC74469.1 TetR/AcrR family transcriptional regulator [Streptomyces sp. CB01881]
MGNREDLLAGAKRCLLDKGYGRTTARDIANASGVSLAAIGYHFGSKESLLDAALIEAMGEWGSTLGAVVERAYALSEDPEERFVAVWDGVKETFAEHRGLWTAQFEAMLQTERAPQLQEALASAQKEGRLGLSALFQGLEEVPDSEEELARGMFYQALLVGLVGQWLAAPELSPTGRDFLRGLRLVDDTLVKPAVS